jgi:hypothetical protein
MRKLIFILSILSLVMTSCIDWGLQELPVYNEAEITAFNLEHRYVVKNANDVEMMAVVTMNTDVQINKENATITVTASVPPATTSFTEAERRKVSLESIIAYAKLSPAAKIEPIDGAPVLGTIGDFTGERKYRVNAADGKTVKIWTIRINPLPLINE